MNQNLHPSCSDTNSFPGFQPWTTREFDVKQKRKLLIEQLSLPTPKLPCWGPNKNHPQELEEEQKQSNLTKMAMEIEVEFQDKGKKDELQISYGHEEDLLEFGSHENSSMIIDEPCCSDTAAQNLLLPAKHSNHAFVLSSGRWTIEPPEAESKTVKPTIDEEFEQYFSVLLPSFDP